MTGWYADRAAAQARAANAAEYGTGETVRGYVSSEYHTLRRQLARELLAEALDQPRTPRGPVLELGSGPDSMVDQLAGLDRYRVAADFATGALSQVSGGRVCLDVTRPLPLRDGSFAAVMMAELIGHVFDPAAALRDLHRVLRPAGVIVLTTPNLAGLQDRLRFLLRLHIRPFTASLLRELFDLTGYDLVTVRSNYAGWQLPSGRWLLSRRLAR